MRWRRLVPFIPFWLLVGAVCLWAVWTSPQSRITPLTPMATPTRALAPPLPWKLGPLERRALTCQDTSYLAWPIVGAEHARVIIPWVTPTSEPAIEMPVIEKER